MKCTNCGFESELDYPVCPQCQAQIQTNPAAQKILGVLKDALFLVICILMSVSCVLSLADGTLPLINILITIFLWLTYAQSQKNIADAKHLRCVSGAVYANYVITYVAAGLVLLLGIICTVAFGILFSDPTFLKSLLSEFASDAEIAEITGALAIIPSGLIFFIFLFVAAIIVVINIFSLRYIHGFAKSVYQSIETGALNLKYANATKVWLFIIGGFSALSCFSADGMKALIATAADCATCIIAGILIHKYLSTEPATAQTEFE